MTTSLEPRAPKKCQTCMEFDKDQGFCKIYDFMPGEGDRKEETDCPSFCSKDNDDLKMLAEYVREDQDGIVDQRVREAVDRILDGYEEQFKLHVIGIARRKIKAMIKMVDMIDLLLDKLTDVDSEVINDMTPSQIIRLLSELNSSVNNDLSFIMKLLQPDSELKDLQMQITNNTLNINGTTKATEIKAEEILKLTGTSREKVREAFDSILHNIDIPEVTEEYEPTEDEKADLEII